MKLLIIIVALAAMAGVSIGPIMSRVEVSDYQIVASDNQFEFRRYPVLLTADVTVNGSRQEAVGDGFRMLADYIFGNNDQQASIAMTAPVMQQPLLDQPDDANAEYEVKPDQDNINQWQVSFVMPADFDYVSLPRPQDTRVKINEKPAAYFAVIQFSGRATTQSIQQYRQQLLDYLAVQDIEPLSAPVYAFYNPPWTLPMMRRNEVMVEVRCSDLSEIDCAQL